MKKNASASSLDTARDEAARVPVPPRWIDKSSLEHPESAAVLAGATLAVLHLITLAPPVPQALWRARLALIAAEACAGFAGRRESAGALRDALCLLRPGDHPGPAGEILRHWTRAASRPLSPAGLAAVMPGQAPEFIARCLEPGTGREITPAGRAAGVIEAVLADAPRAETEALILADAALARALGWDHIVPLLAAGMKSRDLRQNGDALRHACHRALVGSGTRAAGLAADLARRSLHLRAVAPRLRAAGAQQAVALFLARDALAPSALTGFMSDRAARRLCERLVELGAVRELTGRDSFRLYGV